MRAARELVDERVGELVVCLLSSAVVRDGHEGKDTHKSPR